MAMQFGDFVRTKDGISKIVAFYSNAIFNDKNKRIENNLITKSKSKIIDLVEVGDYVNEHRVRAVYLEGATHYIKLEPRDEKGTRIYNEDIKSIVTKEQFERMEYKVGE